MIRPNPILGRATHSMWRDLHSCTRRVTVYSVAFFLAFAIGPRSSHADAIDSAVNLGIEALAYTGSSIGIPISETEKEIIKPLIKDIARGKKPAEALRDAVLEPLIGKLPMEAQEMARCVAKGTSVDTCGAREVIRALPVEARGAAECLGNGTKVADCARQFATQQIAEAVAKLENAAIKQVGDLKDEHFKSAPSAIENILNLVDGIRTDNWEQILENGGAAVTKYVVHFVLAAYLPPGVMILAGPIIDTTIQNRIDLLAELVGAARAHDEVAAARIVVEAYLTFQIEMQCALFKDTPGFKEIPGMPALSEAVCGTLGKIIGEIGKTVGGAVNYVEGLIKDPLAIPGEVMKLPGEVAGQVGRFFNWVSDTWENKKSDCGTAEHYYATKYATCYPRAAYLKITDPAEFNVFKNQLNDQCHQYFDRCFFSDKFAPICDPMRNTFDKHAQDLDTALRDGAAAFTRGLRHFVESKGSRACLANFYEVEEFIGQCTAALGKQIPLSKDPRDGISGDQKVALDPNTQNCVASQQLFSAPSPNEQACRRAVRQSNLNQIKIDVCNATRWNPPPDGSIPGSALSVGTHIFPPSRALPPDGSIPEDLRSEGTTILFPPSRTLPPDGSIPQDFRSGGSIIPRGDPIQPRPLPPDGSIPKGFGSRGSIIPRSDPIPQPAVSQPVTSSGSAISCPPGAVIVNGQCNSGGPYMVQPGGTSVPGVGSVQPKTPSGSATAAPAANTGGFYTVQPGGTSVPGVGSVQPKTPSGSATAGSAANTGGFDTVKPGGTSVPGVGGVQPKTPSGSATAGSAANTGGFDTVKAGGTSVPGVGSAQPKAPSGSGISPAKGINTPAKNASVGAVTSTTAKGNVPSSTRNSRYFRSRSPSANSPGFSANKQLAPNQGVLRRAGGNTGYRRGDPK